MPKVSEAHRQRRREQILTAAAACFAREGIHRTSMQDIVREAELSPGAIYTYFAGKDDIVQAIAEQRHPQEAAIITTATAAAKDAGLGPALRTLARGFFGSLTDPQERVRRRVTLQLWAEALRQPGILETVREGVDHPRVQLAELLHALQRRGEVPVDLDPDSTARAMISLFLGLVLQQAWDEQVDVEAYLQDIEHIINMLVAQVSPPTTPEDRSRPRAID